MRTHSTPRNKNPNGSPTTTTTTPRKRTAVEPPKAIAVTPSPSKRQKKDEDALKRKDISFYMCRFRHCRSARSAKAKKEFPPEAEIMLQLRTFGTDKKASCSALRDFIKAYGVERNFRGMTAENVMPLLPIVKHIQTMDQKLDATVDPAAVVEQVEALADLCKAEGFARNLSFASKALNMLGHNVPIYSSECKAYLGIKTCKDYGHYLSEWMREFEVDRALYEEEVAQITQGKSLETELAPTWFAIRGLDQTMCRVGAPKQVQLLCPACQKQL